VKGKVKVGSHRYEVLVAAAGGADEIPSFCAALLGTGSKP
jgi:phosphoribosylcarboxyaminoimidazole (NCAIR) mutase